MKNFDDLCREKTKNINMLVPWFLMSSYAYYILDSPILSDILYDDLSKQLKQSWLWVEHRHQSFIKPDNLEAGSLYNLTEEEYPTMAKSAAIALIKKLR